MPFRSAILVAALLCIARCWASAPAIHDIATLSALSDDAVARGTNFSFVAKVTSASPEYINAVVEDDTGRIFMHFMGENPRPGDVVRISGRCHIDYDGVTRRFESSDYEIVGTAPVPPPVDVRIADLTRPGLALAIIRVRGRVEQMFADEVDPEYCYVIMRDEQGGVDSDYIICATHPKIKPGLREGAVIEAVGRYIPWVSSARRYGGPILSSSNEKITIVSIPDRIDDAPGLDGADCSSPGKILALGVRKLKGTVLATWGGNQLLMRTEDGKVHRIELSLGQSLPECGDEAVAVGTVETDLYHINLSHAVCTKVGRADRAEAKPKALTPEAILCNDAGEREVKPHYSGRLIRIRGRVTLPQSVVFDRHHMYLNCGRHIVPVDVSSFEGGLKEIPLDSIVEATGVCLMDVDNWQPRSRYPQIRGFSVVARKPSDIRVIATPPWWTPAKFMGVIAALLAALAGFLVWNRSLKLLVDRRSRELLREQISHAGAVLKTEERTRLAVELHDSLSQNLAGVACQIDTTKYALLPDAVEAAGLLTTAKRMLLSCQTELKHCLFDLRRDALNEDNMADAVRTTLRPVVGAAQIALRFSIPRNRLLDTTAHAIICIVRELASNAVRHGHATKLYVAGDLTDNLLMFSVRDNGTGFDAKAAPRPSEGHFGLQGIRDRVNRLGGTLTVESSASGTYAKVAVRLTGENIPAS